MTQYIDGYIVSIAEEKLDAYKKLAQEFGEIWIENGAVQYYECLADDLESAKLFGNIPFEAVTRTREGEVAILSIIIFDSKEERDEINSKVMKIYHEKIQNGEIPMLYTMNRMSYAGFAPFVSFAKK